MSAPETDPFYDALRNRLHDYEEPLPAGGWAEIAPQLRPAPPARPVPKPRQPWRRLAAVLLLLLLPTATLLWWQSRQPGPVARRQPARTAAPNKPVTLNTPPNHVSAHAPAPGAVSSADQPAPAGAVPDKVPHTAPTATARRRTIDFRSRSHAAAGLPPTPNVSPGVTVAAAQPPVGKTHQTSAEHARAPWAAVSQHSPTKPGHDEQAATAPAATSAAVVAGPAAVATTAAPGGTSIPAGSVPATPVAATTTPDAETTSQWTGGTSTKTGAALSASSAAGSAWPAAAPAVASAPGETADPGPTVTPGSELNPNAANTNAATPNALASARATELAAPAAAPTTAPAAATDASDLARLTGLAALLQLPGAGELPTPLAPPPGPRDSLRLRPARLSLGLLLGVAPTHRGAGGVPAKLRALEDPDYGLSAELAARYFVTPSLGLRTGLGLLEQRQQLALAVEKRREYFQASSTQIVVSNGGGGQDTLRVLSYALRDSLLSRESRRYQLTQRYLTLPLAAEWRPRLARRWQPVLSLGATASWLLSGRYLSTTDGCHCQEKTQRGSGPGPFLPVSLTLSAGLGLDYALGLRTTLLLRPTATYGLTPTSRGGAPRPLSAGLQLGLLFDSHRP